jgi:hypothetical protein
LPAPIFSGNGEALIWKLSREQAIVSEANRKSCDSFAQNSKQSLSAMDMKSSVNQQSRLSEEWPWKPPLRPVSLFFTLFRSISRYSRFGSGFSLLTVDLRSQLSVAFPDFLPVHLIGGISCTCFVHTDKAKAA